MRLKDYSLLFVLGLLVFTLAAIFERVPGYMDADYYYAGAVRLAHGDGWVEPYLWNYLNNPPSLPQPAFGYWMPLVSLVAAAGMRMAPVLDPWWAARLPLILIAGCIPPLTAGSSFHLTENTAQARLAGLFALFPGYYLAQMTTTDAFALTMALGGIFFLLSDGGTMRLEARLFGLGVIAGLMHLARADGILWLGFALLVGVYRLYPEWRSSPKGKKILTHGAVSVLAGGLGYTAVMGGWFWRNWQAWGSLFPPGNSYTLWLTRYEQTLIFPANLITSQGWFSAGWGLHFQTWLDALSANLQTTVAVQGGIVLFPFVIIGIVKLWKKTAVRLAVFAWLLFLLVMTFVFPFSGVYGAYFHSSAAFQVLFWSVVPLGIASAVGWAARLRHWQHAAQVYRFLAVLLLITGSLLSAGLYFQHVIGSNLGGVWAWEKSAVHYRAVDNRLSAYGAREGERVLVNNPPGYYLASGRASLVIPFGDPTMLLAAARKYGVDYVVLGDQNPPMLADLYTLKNVPNELEYLGAVGTTQLFRIRFSEGVH